MATKVNVIWNFFERTSDLSKARCKACDRLYSLGSDKPRQQTIHGLKKHLSSCHKQIHHEYLNTKRISEEAVTQENKRTKLGAIIPMPVKVIQPTASVILSSREDYNNDIRSDIAKRIDKAITDFILADILPFSIVEGEAFKRLTDIFADSAGLQRYNVKSETYYRTSLMPATYDAVVARIRNILTSTSWLSLTTDVWTNQSKTCSLLSIIGHFLHELTRSKVVLSVMELEDDLDGNFIAVKLQRAIASWGLQDKIHVSVRDNGAHMMSAMQIANILDCNCLAHTLQLALHEGLFRHSSVEKLIKSVRKIVSYFQHNEQARRKLVVCQKTCDLIEHRLLLDVETRWTSLFAMLERLVEQRRAIDLFSDEHGGFESLATTEWELTEHVVKLLQPFYAAMQEIYSDDACISVAIPLIAMLQGEIDSTEDDRDSLQIKAALRDELKQRCACLKSSAYIAAATLLDPRFKDAYFNRQETAMATAEIIGFLQKNSATANVDSGQQISPVSQSIEAEHQSTNSGLWDAYDEKAIISQPKTNQRELEPVYEQQLAAFLKEPRVLRTTNIYGYWHSSQFPGLEIAAKKYLSTPLTSDAGGQFFNSVGQLYAERRNSLTGENVEKLLFLACNIRLLDFNY